MFFVNWISLYLSLSYKIRYILSLLLILYLDWLAIGLSPVSRKQSRDVTPRLGEGGWFFIFDCSSPFCFLLIEMNWFFHLLYSTKMLGVLLLYLIGFCLTRSSPVSSTQNFYCSLPKDLSRDVTPSLFRSVCYFQSPQGAVNGL